LSKLARRERQSIEDVSSSVPGSTGLGVCRSGVIRGSRRQDSENSSTADQVETSRGAMEDRITAIDSGL